MSGRVSERNLGLKENVSGRGVESGDKGRESLSE